MTAISVRINNEMTTLPRGLSVSALLTRLGYQQQNFAIAINETFVPRSQYATTLIQADDTLEIVAPMQGG